MTRRRLAGGSGVAAGVSMPDRDGRRAARVAMTEPSEGHASRDALAPAPSGVQTVAVTADEAGMRVDPVLEARVPGRDRTPAGCLLVAKPRSAAAALAKTSRSRGARKIYWALVVHVPKPKQGRISTFLAKEEVEHDSRMRIAGHGDEGAIHAVT